MPSPTPDDAREPDAHAYGHAPGHVPEDVPEQGASSDGGGAHLRLTLPEASEASLAAKTARMARILHGTLIFAVAANIVLIDNPSVGWAQKIVGAALCGFVWLAAFRMARRDVTFARMSPLAHGIYRARAAATGAVLMGAIAYFFPWLELTAARILWITLALIIVAAVWGQLTTRLLSGRRVHRTLLIGDGERVGRFVREFHADPHPDFEIVGLLRDIPPETESQLETDTTLSEIVAMFDGTANDLGGVPVLGTRNELETVLAAAAIDTVVLAVNRDRLDLFARLSAWNGQITVQELPAFSEHVFGRVPIDVINAAWFMHMIHPFYRPYSRAVKRAADIMAASFIALLTAPLVPLAAALVKMSSPGPILYSQVRVGERGREFRIWKFRTMRTDAESAGGAQWAQKNDPRVTRSGKFMRSTRLDEIPQLWNILLGHMSFVGPRPERPQFVEELERELPYYQRRHLVKPGLTGWAQVRHGYADTIDAAAHKLGYELYYLKHQSLFLDFVIFVETIRVVALRFGSR